MEDEIVNQEMSKSINAEDVLRHFFAWRLAVNMKLFAKQIGKAVAGKSGSKLVHNLRVSCRKFRTLLKNFSDCLPDVDITILREDFKVFALTLAVNRELVVFCKEVKKAGKTNYTEKATNGFDILKQTCSNLVGQRRKNLQDAVDRLTQSDHYSILDSFISDYHDLDHLALVCQDPVMKSFAQNNLESQLRIISNCTEAIEGQFPGEDFHKLRIQLKNLRYTLEDFACLWTNQFKPQIAKMKQLQDLMGKIHDRQVWLVQIHEILGVVGELYATDEESKACAAFAASILERKWQQQINADFADIKTIWGYLQRDQFWLTFLEDLDELEEGRDPVSSEGENQHLEDLTEGTPDQESP